MIQVGCCHGGTGRAHGARCVPLRGREYKGDRRERERKKEEGDDERQPTDKCVTNTLPGSSDSLKIKWITITLLWNY